MFQQSRFICSDEFIEDTDFISKEDLIEKSDIIILGAPHSSYKNLKINKDKYVYDMWNFFERNTI